MTLNDIIFWSLLAVISAVLVAFLWWPLRGSAKKPDQRLALILAVFVPLASLFLYIMLGAPYSF